MMQSIDINVTLEMAALQFNFLCISENYFKYRDYFKFIMGGQSRLMTPGPLLVWSGQERLAKVSTNAGSWNHGPGVNGKGSPDEGGELKHMFDENPKTFWHSHSHFVNKTKIIKIEFKVSLVSHNKVTEHLF